MHTKPELRCQATESY